MPRKRGCFIALLAFLVVLATDAEAWAWGPATHVKLAADMLSHLNLLPAAVAAIIAAHRRYFIYGNVATDTVLAKKMSKVKQICHRWATGFSLLEACDSEEAQAFAYGYLSHLAADTVAHNKFLPRQMAVSRCTVTFGHVYWEVRADGLILPAYWRRLRSLVKEEYPEPERLLETHLRSTMLSFKTNRVIFRSMNLLASEEAWRKSVDFWARMSRHQMDAEMLREYHEESVGRIVDLLTHGDSSALLNEDPNGNAALSQAKAQRRQIRQLQRARLPHGYVIKEAAAGLAPMPNRALCLTIE